MSNLSDRELVESFQNGREASFNELVLRYQEKLYWIARRFVNDHDVADDIIQEVFIKSYKALQEFRGESSVYTWLYRITVNYALNHIRRNRVREFFKIDEFFDIESDTDEQPDKIYERQEQHELIEQAIGALPEKQKAVFILRYYEELPYEEIAKILKTSVGGLKANYFHAVKNIGEQLHKNHETR
ncbi:MAG TPA: sigma-70 family RNA polymerase sigma factor [Bacteroidota bacterium]|nr:sigma-70 family RNA polymerase sigma factor [Bacteroidota bacterium]